MLKALRRMPVFKLLAVAKTVLLVRRHLQRLDRSDRRRVAALARRGPRMSRSERGELRQLLAKLGPREFAVATADTFSPVPVPRRLGGKSRSG